MPTFIPGAAWLVEMHNRFCPAWGVKVVTVLGLLCWGGALCLAFW